MPDIKISIIVPVYNSEKYLPETAQSILKQSFSDFELILVDDGSKDGSGKICDQLAAKDTRIKVIHKTNGGICSARNAGLKEAAGEYIAFCDNDDIYLPGLLEDNYALAKKYDADVVRYSRSYRTVKDGKVIAEEKTSFKAGVYSSSQFAANFDQINKAGEGIWAGIYRRAFLQKNQIDFDETMKFGYEDLDFITKIYLCSPSVVLNPKTYYVWIMRYAHSTSGKTDINNITSLMKCLENKSRLVTQTGIETQIPAFWVEELSRRIYTIVRYVSPKKVKMPFGKRIELLKYFRTAAVILSGNRQTKAVREIRSREHERKVNQIKRSAQCYENGIVSGISTDHISVYHTSTSGKCDWKIRFFRIGYQLLFSDRSSWHHHLCSKRRNKIPGRSGKNESVRKRDFFY